MILRVVLGAMLSALGACQTAEPHTPAVLAAADDETMTRLRAALSAELGRARIEFGPGDLTRSSTFTVLPPPLGVHESRSVATPVHFELVLRDGACVALRQDSGAEIALPGVACRLAGS